MSVLTDSRQQVADLLGTALDIQAFPFMPGRIVPPAVVILPGTPYLTAGSTFGTYTAQLSAVLIVDSKVSETATPALDDLIEDAIVALVNDGLSVSEVSEPWSLESANAKYLAVTITTNKPVAL